MSQLTQEQFNKAIKTLATKKDLEGLVNHKDFEARLSSLATKKDLEGLAAKKDLESLATKKDLESLATKKDLELTKIELKKHAEGLQEELAVMVKNGFDDVQARLDVKEQIQIFNRKFQKLEEALHIKL